jgi:ATPase subunit of ABC transporter with duplicated ATPase domains
VAEFIYTLRKARKAHGDKVILDDVTLSFLPGAKIGVVGPNGAGKSTLLKIMAGTETVSNGDAMLPRLHRGHPRAGAEAGRLEERVGERRGLGVAETKA